MRYPDYKVAPPIKQHRPQALDRALDGLPYLLAGLPLLLFACLYLCSWRAAAVIGHWPQALIDAPAAIELRDRCFEILAFSAGVIGGLILVAPLAVAALAGAIRPAVGRYWALALIHTASMLLLVIDPGDRLRWLLG